MTGVGNNFSGAVAETVLPVFVALGTSSRESARNCAVCSCVIRVA
jgi:hypothetical protein